MFVLRALSRKLRWFSELTVCLLAGICSSKRQKNNVGAQYSARGTRENSECCRIRLSHPSSPSFPDLFAARALANWFGQMAYHATISITDSVLKKSQNLTFCNWSQFKKKTKKQFCGIIFKKENIAQVYVSSSNSLLEAKWCNMNDGHWMSGKKIKMIKKKN